MSIEQFEKFLLNKSKFISDIRSINKDELTDYMFSIQSEMLDDIIHHFNVLVKEQMSSGIGGISQDEE